MRHVSGLMLIALTLGCGNGAPAPVAPAPAAAASMPEWFKDVTQECGLNFLHQSEPKDSYFMPRTMGSGAAGFGFDGGGLLDHLFLSKSGPGFQITPRLYRQEKDGRFKDVTAGSGLDVSGYGMGVAIGDVNNDGYPDVLITEYRGARLFLNNHGNGTFTEVTKEAGLDCPLWGASAA